MKELGESEGGIRAKYMYAKLKRGEREVQTIRRTVERGRKET